MGVVCRFSSHFIVTNVESTGCSLILLQTNNSINSDGGGGLDFNLQFLMVNFSQIKNIVT